MFPHDTFQTKVTVEDWLSHDSLLPVDPSTAFTLVWSSVVLCFPLSSRSALQTETSLRSSPHSFFSRALVCDVKLKCPPLHNTPLFSRCISPETSPFIEMNGSGPCFNGRRSLNTMCFVCGLLYNKPQHQFSRVLPAYTSWNAWCDRGAPGCFTSLIDGFEMRP